MSTKAKGAPVQRSNVFICETCNDGKEIDANDIKVHLKEVHKLEDFKGRRETLMHMDGTDWFSWEFRWTIGDVKLIQNTISPRRKDDPMRFES